MPKLFALRCPTCGANLQIAGDKNQFSCEHRGAVYHTGNAGARLGGFCGAPLRHSGTITVSNGSLEHKNRRISTHGLIVNHLFVGRFGKGCVSFQLRGRK